MNGRRRFFSTIGLGFLLAGGAAAAAGEDRASTAEPQRTLAPIAPQQRAQYKVFTIPAGDTVPAGCDVTAIPSSFSSNGCPSSRSRRRTGHHYDLPLALMTRHRLSSRVRRPKPLVALPSGEISRKSQARLHALPSDIPLHWPCRHTAIESNLGKPS